MYGFTQRTLLDKKEVGYLISKTNYNIIYMPYPKRPTKNKVLFKVCYGNGYYSLEVFLYDINGNFYSAYNFGAHGVRYKTKLFKDITKHIYNIILYWDKKIVK